MGGAEGDGLGRTTPYTMLKPVLVVVPSVVKVTVAQFWVVWYTP